MGFWSWLSSSYQGITANSNATSTPPTVGAGDYTPGDPDGVNVEGEETFSRSLPMLSASAWDGWPADWATPHWHGGFQRLVDVAWAGIDLNASVLASMPVYRLRSGEVMEPETWMSNPDPLIYSSWHEFMKQLLWDYQLGEAFVLPMARFADGFPQTFRVVPPWLVSVELLNGTRRYWLAGQEVTDEILHIRYHSTTMDARGHGPLEASGARVVTIGLLTRYISELAETGGVPEYWISSQRRLSRQEADQLLEEWIASRKQKANRPAVLSGGTELNQAQQMSAENMQLLELAQFSEARIAIMLGVPPFLLGLPSGGDSLTYSNVSSLFDFHYRSSLSPKADAVMTALSHWALPRGQSVELNRDFYVRPDFFERTQAYEKLWMMNAMSVEEIRRMERLHGDAPNTAATGLTGGDQ